jgi:hypothetical protein
MAGSQTQAELEKWGVQRRTMDDAIDKTLGIKLIEQRMEKRAGEWGSSKPP